jgi:hypothetical protein
MSISNLFSENNYNVFCGNLSCNNFTPLSIQADNYNYLFTNKNTFLDSRITGITNIDTNFTALTLGGGLANSQFEIVDSNTGFKYIGGLNFVSLLITVNASVEKIATNTLTSISITKDGQAQPLTSGCVFVDKTEGHFISFSRLITIQNNDILRVRAQCQTGTARIAIQNTPNSNAPALQLTVIGVPSQKPP